MTQSKTSGFTLIEMLIATTIFAIVSIAAYNALSLIIKHDEQLAPRQQSIAALSRTSGQIIDDMLHVINRPVVNHLGSRLSPLIITNTRQSDTIMEFTRLTPLFFGAVHNNVVQRVIYKLIESTLYRGVWLYLDRSAFDVEPVLTPLLTGVDEVEITILVENNRIENVFQMTSYKPKQIRFVFTIAGLGDYTIDTVL